ncbi:MAG: hypothetical protein ABJO02_09185, partial [Reichenbachiella sp.]|uniref:hypothetical protein n=2 Tax=Reichenbachiella sp. TaxID=2184521 RepID=UPI00329720CF
IIHSYHYLNQLPMLQALFSRTKDTSQSLKLKFNKNEKSWVVLKGHSIMFIGGEDQCKTYINNFS